MTKLWDSMRVGYAGFVEDGQYLMLFMTALLLLWLLEGTEKKTFKRYSLVLLLLLLCPLTAKLLLVYQTAFYDYGDLWGLLPVTGLLAYALVIAVFQMMAAITRGYGRWQNAMPRKKERIYEITAVVILTAVLFLCGTLTPGREMTGKTGNRNAAEEGTYEKAQEVLEELIIPENGTIMLLAPDEIASWARIYNGNICLPYGRSLWEQELSAYTYDFYMADMQELHDWVNGELPAPDTLEEALKQEEMFLSLAASSGYEYLVFTRERNEQEVLQGALERQKEYGLYAGTGEYVIYRLS